jgi:PilZ domain
MEQPRRVPRYPFSAPADLTVEHTGATAQVRVKELSLYGCFVEAPITLSSHTQVRLKIYGPHDYFEAKALVIYTQPNSGLGLVFWDVRPGFQPILKKWLLQAMQK